MTRRFRIVPVVVCTLCACGKDDAFSGFTAAQVQQLKALSPLPPVPPDTFIDTRSNPPNVSSVRQAGGSGVANHDAGRPADRQHNLGKLRQGHRSVSAPAREPRCAIRQVGCRERLGGQ